MRRTQTPIQESRLTSHDRVSGHHTNPTAAWTTQAARSLIITHVERLEDARALVRDRGSQFIVSIFRTEGLPNPKRCTLPNVNTTWRNLILAAILFTATSCTTTPDTTTDNTNGTTTVSDTIGPILYVERNRANVGDSDDFHGASLRIERVSPDETACVHFQPSVQGRTIAFLALLAESPDEVGVDYFRIGTMTVRSGDIIRGDFELGSAQRPPHLAQAHTQARTQLIKACAPLNLDQQFDQVFDTAPIIFIEHVEPQQ
jgi:hypothetical protein